MPKEKDIEALEQQLHQAKQVLALKVGTNMVDRHGIKSYSAYANFMRNAKQAIKQAHDSEMPQIVSDRPQTMSKELRQEATQFRERLELWQVDHYNNRIDYKTFYPELLDFFRKLDN